MRRGSWILAMAGMMTLPASVSLGEDPFAQPGAPTGTSGRYQLRPASAPKPNAERKNYFDDLFQGEAAAAAAPAAGKAPTVDAKSAAGTPAWAQETASGSGVKTAGHAEPEARPSRQPIQQVRAVRPSSAPATRQPATPKTAATNQLAAPTGPAVGASASAPAGAAANKAAPHVSVEWLKSSAINVGQECEVELVVRNLGEVLASDVEVTAFFPNTVRLTSAVPKPAEASDRVVWRFPRLAASEQHSLKVKLIPSTRGDLAASAQVRFTGAAVASFQVAEPLLKVALKAPSSVMIGDPIAQLITITNPGTGAAHDVKIEAVLTDGLEHVRGNRVEMEIGSLNPGETRTVRLGLAAIKGGKQSVNVTAVSSSELSDTASNELEVVAPSLKIAVNGPGLRYKGRAAKYVVEVTNDGTVPNNNVRVSQVIAKGFSYVAADRGGKFDPSQNAVHWFLGRLEPGQTIAVNCELLATELGDFKHLVQVASDSGVRGDSSIDTKVEGASALSMEIVDLDDPVEVGTETAYEIRLKNDGSKAATDVAIRCELAAGIELVNATGPTNGALSGQKLAFQPIAEIPAGGQVIYRVHVRSGVEGNYRMRVELTSSSMTEPLSLEESTKFYNDARK